VLKTSVAGSAATSVQAGSFLTLQATVTSPQPVKFGYIAFYDGSTVLGQVEISGGSGTFSTNLLSIGTHNLSAQYTGYIVTGQYVGTGDFQASTSAPVAVNVSAIGTTLTLTPSAASVTLGSVLTLTAKAVSSSGLPVGGVSFFDGTTPLGTTTLDASGSAAYSTVSLAAGPHSLTARYAANGMFAGSSSSPSVITVNAASPSLATTFTQLSAFIPGTGLATNTVSVHVAGKSTEGGNVSLLVDGQVMATSALSANGEANVSLGRLGSGKHTLFASYTGSSVSAPSASPSFETTAYASGPDFTVQALANLAANASGSPVTLTVGAVGGWSGTISFRCASGLPQGYQCVFTPGSVSGAGQTSLTIERSGVPAGAALLLLPFAWLLAGRRRRQAALVVFLAAGLVCLSSCATARPGGSTQSSVVTVEATSGSLIHSSQFTWNADPN